MVCTLYSPSSSVCISHSLSFSFLTLVSLSLSVSNAISVSTLFPCLSHCFSSASSLSVLPLSLSVFLSLFSVVSISLSRLVILFSLSRPPVLPLLFSSRRERDRTFDSRNDEKCPCALHLHRKPIACRDRVRCTLSFFSIYMYMCECIY